ncbi:MAG: hypothetical protein IPN34_26175 [Planctomycetes bacterium]|nr:hypothetical protein [Planctomycetota bacterium]
MSAQDAAPGCSRRTALGVTALLVMSFFALVAALSDAPRLSRPITAERAQRAAFAIRDRVYPFQQWGSRAFSLPLLESAYGRVEYLTLRADGSDGAARYRAQLGALLESGVQVDLFLLAHSNPFVAWTRELDAAQRERIRLVYNTGCFDLRQRDEWLALGADAYVGHVGNSASSLFYVFFLRAWIRGDPLAEILEDSNALTARFLHRLCAVLGARAEPLVEATRAELGGAERLAITGVPR